MSAYPAEVLVQHGLSDPHVHFLAKPFTHDELLRKVEQASDRREPSGPWRRTRAGRAIGPDRPWFDSGSTSEV
jgi:hypothetical protein